MRGKGFQQVPPTDRLLVMTPGGAGIGDPAQRERSKVSEDAAEGLISGREAASVYGGRAGRE
jgi:N-methylhydantoinase B